VLLDAGVKEDSILMLSLLAAPEGIHKVGAAGGGWWGPDLVRRIRMSDFVTTKGLLLTLLARGG
jgi:hypothetical protein